MLLFCGQERCQMDASGRIRLSSKFAADFMQECQGQVVMHGLPEGALALYPEAVYREMRRREMPAGQEALNFAARRTMRRFGALTREETITAQGRVTIPPMFREYAELKAGSEICVVGVEIGVELWNPQRYAAEMEKIRQHMQSREAMEMKQDLNGGTL